jgi:hypothetical protein
MSTWQTSPWTFANLQTHGFEEIDKSTICAVDDGKGRAFIVCVYTRDLNGAMLTRFADHVIHKDGSAQWPRTKGQSVVSKRGGKKQSGGMLMYGTHTLFGVNATKEGLPAHWQPAVFLPSGGTDMSGLYDIMGQFAARMTQLECSITPVIGEERRRQINMMDPSSRHRMHKDCDALSLSITSSYAVVPHDDSGIINESILFANRFGSMPPGHAWHFVVAGKIFRLPDVCASRGYSFSLGLVNCN